jgi:hypothetical protein
MRNRPRRGLQDIPTRSGLAGQTENPQRRFLRIASLELKKSLCEKVRDAARRRAEEMENKIVEIETEKAQLIGESQVARPSGSVPAADGSNQPCGFTLRY